MIDRYTVIFNQISHMFEKEIFIQQLTDKC